MAQQFAVAVFSYDWRTGSEGQLAAVKPWAAPAVIAEMASSPGAPASEQQRTARHEVDRVGLVTVALEDRTASAFGYAVSVAVTVTERTNTATTNTATANTGVANTGVANTASAGPSVELRQYVDLQVARGPSGWWVTAAQS